MQSSNVGHDKTTPPHRRLQEAPTALVLPIMLVMLLGTLVLCVALGTVRFSPGEVWRCLLSGLGLYPADALDAGHRVAILMVRLPRVLVALLAGAGLAVSGAVMQGVFRNPLAEPGILGVSAGASLGALLAFTGGFAGMLGVPVAAFCGGMLCMGAILLITGGVGGREQTATLVMSGMAVGALVSALTSLVLTRSNEYQITSYLFWTMGGLANRRWEHVWMLLPPLAVCLSALLLLAGRIDVLQLGDEQAQALGLHPGRTRLLALALASLCAACVVAVTGPIGFVGLILPHILRLLFGPRHRRLLALSAVGGAMFLALCDLGVRLLAGPQGIELSVGIVTALLGAPFFLFLLVRRRKGGMGLA